MHAQPSRRTTRRAMLAGAAAMGVALIGGPAEAAEPVASDAVASSPTGQEGLPPDTSGPSE